MNPSQQVNSVGVTGNLSRQFTRENIQNIQNIQTLLAKIKTMQARGDTEANNPEFAQAVQTFHNLRAFQQQQQQQQQQQNIAAVPSVGSSGINGGESADTGNTLSTTITSTMNTQNSQISPTPLSADQLMSLKYQILAFKLISRGLPVPPLLQKAMFSPGQVQGISAQDIVGSISLPGKIVEASNNHHNQQASSIASTSSADIGSSSNPTGSSIPYNSYTNPHTYLKPFQLFSHESRQQRMLIPSIMPVGLDPQEIAAERHRHIEFRAQQRIHELENINNEYKNGNKLKALIEYKALKVRHIQRKVRQDIISIGRSTPISTSDRTAYKKMKKSSMRDARNTDRLEKQQREERQRKQVQKHLDYLQSIINHRNEMQAWHRTHQLKQAKLGRMVLAYHSQIEKEEQKRMERISKERIKALKNDDEEAYLKLIDQNKDKRIAHLLKQTDSYLDSLAQAVVAQQNDELHNDPSVRGEIELMDDDENTEINGKKIDYYAVAHRIHEEVEQPNMMEGGTLKEYQVKGLQWMISLYNNRLNGILADEMGLGKTIQTISLVTYLIERKKQNGPYLIVVPLSTLTNWTMEFEKWAPSVRKCVYKGAPNVRKAIQQQYIKHVNFQVLLTTYEYIIKDKTILSKIRWVYVIIDEGHRMKNVNSKLSIILTNNYQCRYRLILTGTPLQNNLPELWSLLNFILPKIFDSVKSFDEWFNTPFANGIVGQEKIALNEEESLLIIRRLHKVLRPFLLRRLKKDVESELPDKVERVVKCKLSALQLKLYNQMKKHGVLFVNTGEKGKTGIKGLNNTIMQLRKICNHPFVFEEVETDINPYKRNNQLLFRVSGKFELLDRILPKFKATNHRVLIFFQMTAIMTIMEDFLNFRGYKYLRLDGTTKAEDRSIKLNEFNAADSSYFVFLLSTRAGGLGLNLQSADTVIIFDSDWNPHQDLQAQDRAHRIGQTKEVRILRLISQKSIEETILARAQYKLDIDGKVIQAGKFDNKSTAEEREAFLRSLLEGDNDEANDVEEEDELDDDELNEIISRNDDELALFKRMDLKRAAEEEAEWRASGGRGKRPERLIEERELPNVYMKEYDTVIQREDNTAEYGRGQRPRGEVHYDDGLTEDQWVNAIQDDDVDVHEMIAKKQAAKKRRLAKKNQKLLAQEVQKPTHQQQPTTQYDETNVEISSEFKKKRGRPRKDDTHVTDDVSESLSKSKKKGKNKRIEIVDFGGSSDQPKNKKRKANKKSQDDDNIHEGSTQQEQTKRIFMQCYSTVENLTDDSEGEPRQRAFLFLVLPSKKDYPFYYQIIAKPIAMDTIKKRIKNNLYKSVKQFRDDWNLMFNNARTFNEEGSQVYIDADKMQEAFNAKLEELCPNDELPNPEGMDL
ncbi:SNF2-family ATP dependent chromatin remodeling factor snf21 [Rhizophagus clarus]|uniref:SNF2-family ATP dependent chromatin remodeling factor snf21 n=1 Tax=Rhizophagus clarus TaxID=94130 RepID=A0A8H3KZH3_9GLOM|nr:SNF2-family ATP dependent chromatin remodeling factor snf21 [Rhizophagus clarus]